MKRWILVLSLEICVLVSGCVGSTGWTKKDGQPFDQVQFEKDREECNRGWAVYMTADILLTAGLLSLIHYAEAKHCMTVKGYQKIKEPLYMAHSGPHARHYHQVDCPEGLRAISFDRRIYVSLEEAKARGLIPCPKCMR